ncbi:Protein sidekick-2 [Branchiostoma belcheri]|nr:Protein sidekick-2 [Branchiostoma belcheri]
MARSELADRLHLSPGADFGPSLNHQSQQEKQQGTMGSKLEGLLLVLLLILLKETGSTTDCRSSCRLSACRCNDRGLRTVPQDLPTTYDELSAIYDVRISNNPWQCDCRIRPFRLKMTGSSSFANGMTCFQPDNLQRQKLKDIDPEDLNCEEPTIVSFQRGDENTLGQELTLRLVCQVSGTPSPDVTVTLPSGLNVTVESVGRVTVQQVNGTTSTITITNATSADSGLYICTAPNHVGSAFATLSVDVQLNAPTANTKAPSLAGITSTSTHPTNSSFSASFPTFSLPVPVGSTPSEDSNPDQSHTPTANAKAPPLLGTTSTSTHPTNSSYLASFPTFSLPVGSTPSENSNPTLIVTIAGAVVGTVLIGIILLTFCCWKRWTRNRSIGPDPGVVGFNNRDTTATVTTSGHD